MATTHTTLFLLSPLWLKMIEQNIAKVCLFANYIASFKILISCILLYFIFLTCEFLPFLVIKPMIAAIKVVLEVAPQFERSFRVIGIGRKSQCFGLERRPETSA